MTEIKKTDQCKNLLNLAEGLRKSEVVTEIVENLAEGFADQIELILTLVCLSDDILSAILLRVRINNFDSVKFFKYKEYKEKVLTEFYVDKYPYLSQLKVEGELVIARLNEYVGTDIPVLPSSLQSLYVRSCDKLTSLSGLEGCKNLQCLKLYDCDGLTSLSCLEGCEELESLDIDSCYGLTSLKGIQRFKNLQSLKVGSCNNLECLTGIEACENLERLSVSFCKKLTSLSCLEGCEELESLDIDSCYGLTSLKGIQRFKNLQSLCFYDCYNLKSLSGIEACKNLRMLKIDSITLKKLDLESKEVLKRLEENSEVEVVYI